MERFELETPERGFVDITARVRQIVARSGVGEGICVVYCPHTTAAITINENADPDVMRDLKFALERTFPDRREFRHAEGNSAAHLKSSCVGASEVVPIAGGSMVLGTWQGIYFCEFDGPRRRKCCVQIVGA